MFRTYEANPVLTADDPVMDCGTSECDLGGFTVAVDPSGQLRFLVARIVDPTMEARRDLLPLRQVWPVD